MDKSNRYLIAIPNGLTVDQIGCLQTFRPSQAPLVWHRWRSSQAA
jgi:hypothetical protein